MKKLLCMVALCALGIVEAKAQEPVLPKTGTWDTFGETQSITVESKKNPPITLDIKTAPTKKVVMACHYLTSISNTTGKDVSFVIHMVSPSGPTSSDEAKVKLKAGETKEVTFMIGNCKGKGDEAKKFEGCCGCAFSFAFDKISVGD